MFKFKQLDVYQRAIEFVSLSTALAQELPRGHAALKDQLRRASLSIPLNIAEASGRTTTGDAAHHFAIARGSAMECAAILDVMGALALTDTRRLEQGEALLARITAMLTKLAR